MPLSKPQRAAVYQLKAYDQASAFGVVAAKAPGREDLDPRIRPRAQNALLKSLGNSMVVAMADGNVAAGKPALPHASCTRPSKRSLPAPEKRKKGNG